MATSRHEAHESRINRSSVAARLRSIEPALYLLYAGTATLLAARGYFAARTQQLNWAEAARLSLDAASATRNLEPVWWSAPLDDTFIHFDFARSCANLRPFEWATGGGYSSGATSWSYPLVLALAVAFGCTGQALGVFADVLACVSMFAFFWATRSLFLDLPRWASYLLPPIVLTNGVLGWSLWSGMELALFFAVWGLLAHYYQRFRRETNSEVRARTQLGMALAGLLLVATRPEAILCVGVYALFAAARGDTPRMQSIAKILSPALAFTAIRAFVNLVLTGSFADAGALVKLHTLRPFLEPRDMALKWFDNIAFQFTRITTYHTIDDASWGWLFWSLLSFAFVPKRTRGVVVLLVLQAIGWILLVAQNEYVRYQNDRYTMPALLWMLVAVAIGWGGNVAEFLRSFGRERVLGRAVKATAATLLLVTFLFHQMPRSNQQRWLFGRACRNIAEQQVRTGQLLGTGHFGQARRVLMGDAGAIPYFSELAGVDAIGLGGTDGLPFAKAVNLGVGATVELIERMAPEARPDLMALYPSWWDLLPVWFGRPLEEIRIHGNVICGAANKVVYEADWRSLETHSRPATLSPNIRILDEVDFADVVSEIEHGYELTSKHSGYVVMKVLPHPAAPRKDLFDAGRLVFSDAKVRFYLRGFLPGKPARLVFRAAPDYHMAFRVSVDGRNAGRVEMGGGDTWQEQELVLDPKRLRPTIAVELTAETSEHILYHLWATSP